jgi:hypothetical protein
MHTKEQLKNKVNDVIENAQKILDVLETSGGGFDVELLTSAMQQDIQYLSMETNNIKTG